MTYVQVTPEERYTFAALRTQVPPRSNAEIARLTGRHRSTIGRELRRNRSAGDKHYRASKAQEQTNGRRSRSRRNSHFGLEDWQQVDALLAELFSPEQISGRLRLDGLLEISHESIYQHVWKDKRQGGQLYRHLRQQKQRRKRGGSYDRRGRLVGKRNISERPAAAEERSEIGHWEMDTVCGSRSNDAVVTMVERVTGSVLIGKLRDHSVASLNHRVLQLMRGRKALFKTITVDNGTEFHGYRRLEAATDVVFYFANPYHSWERGTNENTNGLVRQYLPKRQTMLGVTQQRCNGISDRLNSRPRKRLGYLTPFEVLDLSRDS